jgi:hypothetical protein
VLEVVEDLQWHMPRHLLPNASGIGKRHHVGLQVGQDGWEGGRPGRKRRGGKNKNEKGLKDWDILVGEEGERASG